MNNKGFLMKHGLSKRVAELRERALTEPLPASCGGQTFSWNRIAALAKFQALNAATVIRPGELIVGVPGYFTNEDMAEFQDPIPESVNQPCPENIRALIDQGFFILCGNHQVANYRKVLDIGLRGIMDNIETALADQSLPGETKDFLSAMRVLAESQIQFCHRYAATAHAQAQDCSDPTRRSELEIIAGNCERVIEFPPRTFWEACQALFFTFLIIPDSPGRIDQYLYPYYQQDIDSGRITPEFAEELLCCLWIKYFEYWGKDHLRSGVTHLALGGLTPEGECAVNPVSYMCLDAAEKLSIIRPQIAIRCNRKTPREFIRRGVELLRRNFGSPDFCSDEQIVPALVNIGIPPADARDYCPSGCHEIMIPGKSQMGALMGEFNLPKTLTHLLGVECMPGAPQIALTELHDWKSFRSSWRKIMAYTAKAIHELSYFEDERRDAANVWVNGSLLTDGCIESGRSLARGGALYNHCNWDAIGLANLADSFIAIKQLVYDNHEITLAELAQHLKDNWRNGESLRYRIAKTVPQFGNNQHEVDNIAAEIIRDIAAALESFTPYRGGKYILGTLAGYENAHAVFGNATAATPDGRRAGDPFPGSLGPAPGRDRSGITAALNSVAAIPHELLPTSTVVNVTVDPGMLRTEAGVDKLAAAIIAHFDSGGQQLQFTIADAELLRQARLEPEKHSGLMVRVAGYSARFTSLENNVQEDIIARTVNSF